MAIDPFKVLIDIERNSLTYALPLPQKKIIGDRWQGIGFKASEQYFVANIKDIVEVIHPATITPLPGSAAWFQGVCNYRGHLLPVTDLAGFVTGENVAEFTRFKTHILVVSHEASIAGFIVPEVLGIQYFMKDSLSEIDVSLEKDNAVPYYTYTQGIFTDVLSKTWKVLDFKSIMQNPKFYHLTDAQGKLNGNRREKSTI